MSTPPILLVIFNRPETTQRVVEAISNGKPAKLFIAADGPRHDVIGESILCERTRRIATNRNWHCELSTLFREENLGLGKNMASAITWFFSHVEEGIILEDDCIPQESFFRFCKEMLSYYRGAPKIMHISGSNFQYGKKRGSASYYFSKYAHCWGWATWKRAWQYFDYNIGPQGSKAQTWAYQWQLSIEKQGGVGIIPTVNLVSNVGFDRQATHTKTTHRFSFLKTKEMSFPLKHPKKIKVNQIADLYTFYANYKNVKHLNLFWLYVFWDFIRKIKSALYKWMNRKIARGNKKITE